MFFSTPYFEIISTKYTIPIITVITIASFIYPSPVARPTAIEKKTLVISFESPGTLLNLISANAPAMENALATLLPTSIITTDTTAGKITSVIAKFVENLLFLSLKI